MIIDLEKKVLETMSKNRKMTHIGLSKRLANYYFGILLDTDPTKLDKDCEVHRNWIELNKELSKVLTDLVEKDIINKELFENDLVIEFIEGYEPPKPVDPKQEFKKYQMQEILSKEMPKFRSLGVAIHNDVFYFGNKINDENGKMYDAVITSDHNIYVAWQEDNQIKEEFELPYRFSFMHEIIDNIWSRTGKYGIKNWLNNSIELITLKQVYERVLKLQKWKMWHPDEIIHKYHALNIIAGYFLPIFEARGRDAIYGESGFGKTRQSKIYQLLAFNPIMSMDWTSSSVFRMIESTKGTIIIDNFDDVQGDERGRVLRLYNTGYISDQKAIRTEGKGYYSVRGFDIFSSMVLNSIIPLREISENRSNITRCLKSNDPIYKLLEKNNPEWQETRDMLHVCALQNYKEIEKIYKELSSDRLVARDFERALSVLTIAKAISEELYNDMLSYFEKDSKRRKVKNYKDDWFYNAFEYIIERLEDKEAIELRVKDIAEAKAPLLFNTEAKNYDTKIRGFSIYLGKMFSSIPLFSSRVKDGYTVYNFTKDGVIKYCKMKGFDEIIKDLTVKDFLVKE